jgi:hypothetical protein
VLFVLVEVRRWVNWFCLSPAKECPGMSAVFCVQCDGRIRPVNDAVPKFYLLSITKLIRNILDFKLSPWFEYCVCSFGYFPGEIPKRTYTKFVISFERL